MKQVPLDPVPVAPGTKRALYLVNDLWAYGLKHLTEEIVKREAVSFARAEEIVHSRYPAHVAHFTRCPDADQHRRAS